MPLLSAHLYLFVQFFPSATASQAQPGRGRQRCLRSRPPDLHRPARGRCPAWALRDAPCRASGRCRQNFRAVSYTHLVLLDAALNVADGSEIFVELAAVGRAELGFQTLRLILHQVQHALVVMIAHGLRLPRFRRRARAEEPVERLLGLDVYKRQAFAGRE